MLALALIGQASVAAVSASTPLEDVFAKFEDICIANSELADQKKAADALPGVNKEYFPSRDPVTGESRLPQTRYRSAGLEIGMIGFSKSATCYVTAHVDPTMEAEALRSAVGARFASKPDKTLATKDFYHGGWHKKNKTFDVEWKRKDGKVIALLSIRTRDGFAK